MKKRVYQIAAVIMSSVMLLLNSQVVKAAENEETITFEDVNGWILDSLEEQGLIEEQDRDKVAVVDSSSSSGIQTYSEEGEDISAKQLVLIEETEEGIEYTTFVPYVELENGELMNSYEYASRALVNPQGGSCTVQEDLSGSIVFSATATYTEYFSRDNGWNTSVYKHGSVSMRVSGDVSAHGFSNVKVAYITAGPVFDEESMSFDLANYQETVSRIEKSSLIINTTYNTTNASNGNLSIVTGATYENPNYPTYSAVVYGFEYNRKQYNGGEFIISGNVSIDDLLVEQGWDD